MGRICVYAVCVCYCCHCKWKISTQGTWILAAMPSAGWVCGFLESYWIIMDLTVHVSGMVKPGWVCLSRSKSFLHACRCMALVWLPHTLASPRGFALVQMCGERRLFTTCACCKSGFVFPSFYSGLILSLSWPVLAMVVIESWTACLDQLTCCHSVSSALHMVTAAFNDLDRQHSHLTI